MKRRTFLKSLAATGLATSITGTGALSRDAHAKKKVDFGAVKDDRS